MNLTWNITNKLNQIFSFFSLSFQNSRTFGIYSLCLGGTKLERTNKIAYTLHEYLYKYSRKIVRVQYTRFFFYILVIIFACLLLWM